MKNYPLNPYQHKWKNYNATYLQELHAKIFALKHYSDFFLTDFIEVEIDDNTYEPLTITIDKEKGITQTYYIIRTERFGFHEHGYFDRDCYLKTDKNDSSAIQITDDNGNLWYLRPIPAGTSIISNARAEGTIDASGITEFWLEILSQDAPSADMTWGPLMVALDLNSETIEYFNLGMTNNSSSKASPARTDWHNFLIQPTSYASFYVPSLESDGINFVYYQRGGSEYGNSTDIILSSNLGRYTYQGNKQAVQFNVNNMGHAIYNKSADGNTVIGTPSFILKLEVGATKPSPDTTKPVFAPWSSRSQPLMSFLFLRNPIKNDYGEEIVVDYNWNVNVAKLENTTALQYTIDIQENNQLGTWIVEAELI